VLCTFILTWKSASRHDGVQFFISHLASWLSTRRFSEPTFRPSGPKSLENIGLSYLFTHLHFLSSYSSFFLSFSSLGLFPALLFICPYCRMFDF
jgi:hypothetical protein